MNDVSHSNEIEIFVLNIMQTTPLGVINMQWKLLLLAHI